MTDQLDIQEQKKRFIEREVEVYLKKEADYQPNVREIWYLSWRSTMQVRRGKPVYKEKGKNHSAFNQAVFKIVKNLYETQYKNGRITHEQHITNLSKLITDIEEAGKTEERASILHAGTARWGWVQKLLNIHLKYQWCLGNCPTPPHCPFDSIVIDKKICKELKDYPSLIPLGLHIDEKRPQWTKFDDQGTYEKLVIAAERLAAKDNIESLSAWELRHWNKEKKVT